MPDWPYLATALAIAVAITIALRALPFALKDVMSESALITDLGRWMPLGAVAILAVSCLASVDLAAPRESVGTGLAALVTVGVHAWRRNAVLSIVAGTVTCLLVLNT